MMCFCIKEDAGVVNVFATFALYLIEKACISV